MERTKLIKPITVVKVKKYAQTVFALCESGVKFSLDKLAREQSISCSTGTAMIELGLIEKSEGGLYLAKPELAEVKDSLSKKIIEQVRKRNIDMKNKNITDAIEAKFDQIANSVAPLQVNSSQPAIDIQLKEKSLKQSEMAPILEKIFNSINEGKQSDIFDGIKNVHNERVHVASAIASGVYSSLSTDYFPHMLPEVLEEINDKIMFATADLMDKILNYKK